MVVHSAQTPASPATAGFKLSRAGIWTTGIVFVLLAFPVSLTALGAASGLLLLPYELHMIRERVPVAFAVHMYASGTALLLIPFVYFSIGFTLHRYLGRITAALVLVGGIAALPVGWASVALPLARAGFMAQGLTWVAFNVAAYVAVRRGDLPRHGWLMLAMTAVASGAIWLRFTTVVLSRSGLPFNELYALGAWLAWFTPLAIALMVWRRHAVVEQGRA